MVNKDDNWNVCLCFNFYLYPGKPKLIWSTEESQKQRAKDKKSSNRLLQSLINSEKIVMKDRFSI